MISNKELVDFLVGKGFLKSAKIIDTFTKTDRKKFVKKEYIENAYDDIPLPIAPGATISQPSTVAAMTEALDVESGMKVLEIGTGSGYQSALLAELVGGKGKVITIEINKEVYEFGKSNLKNYHIIEAILSDGSLGYEKEAPYDRIIVTAAASTLPEELIKQLKVSGIMIIPIGREMFKIIKISETEIRKEFLGYYAFVPLR